MKVGVVFPQTEIGADPYYIRDYGQAAEELGFAHILAYDHVVGANPASRANWRAPYSHMDMFHEPLVLFSYLAGVTRRIEFCTGIIIAATSNRVGRQTSCSVGCLERRPAALRHRHWLEPSGI